MTRSVIVLLLLLTHACTDDTLDGFCPDVCWNIEKIDHSSSQAFKEAQKSDKYLAGQGECKTGSPICDENHRIIECVGEVLPEHEVCDGLDNDCDGKVDERQWDNGPLFRYSREEGFDCLTEGVCWNVKQVCVKGRFECAYPEQYEAVETQCDGIDNDCDGETDEELFMGEYCYDAPWHTVTVSPCHAGTIACVNGERVCLNQSLPQEEVCDFIDNDCDGIVDNTDTLMNTTYDIVFLLDTSPSMCNEFLYLAAALDHFVAQFENNSFFKFAIVNISDDEGVYYVRALEDFTNLRAIQQAIERLRCHGSPYEASLDAMAQVCHPDNTLNLSWTEGSNKISFLFTDEKAQSYTTPTTSPTSVIQVCQENNVRNYIWATELDDFRSIAEETGGQIFDLGQGVDQLVDNMNSVIQDLCID